MKMIAFALVSSFAFLCGAAQVTASTPETPRDLSLVLLIGQSNMAGRAAIEPQDIVPIPGVFKLDAESQWVPAIDPLHFDKPKVAGVGLGREFARTLVKARPGAQIGLIPAAVGGTSLDQWKVGGELYNQALARLRVAQKSGKLVAILWHQGEADSSREERASSYASRWIVMMKQLRIDAGAPNVPIVAGEIGEYLHRTYAHVVNEQIDSLPKLLDHVASAPVKGLTAGPDGLHFDSASQREFGRRYAAAFFTIAPKWSVAQAR
jgi:Carbohydrate esterase, sialic acid-specific acetylesterase